LVVSCIDRVWMLVVHVQPSVNSLTLTTAMQIAAAYGGDEL